MLPSPVPVPASPEPNQDEIINWKTYRNDKYNYSFSSGIVMKSCGRSPDDFSGEEKFVLVEQNLHESLCYPFEGSGVEIYTLEGDETKDVYYSRASDSENCTEEVTFEPVTIDEANGYAYTVEGDCYTSGFKETRIFKNGLTYAIHALTPVYDNVYKQILSSFEFIDTPKTQVNFEQQCVSGGGSWKQFPNDGQYCHDECNRPVGTACLRNTSFGCDCGTSACWDGSVCVSE